MEVTYSSSNLHGGNMHLCNVHSGNVQQSACTACNVQVGCMRHLHCTALDSCNDCSAIFLHSGHVTTCIDRSRQKEAALYKVCCSLSATQESNVQPAAVLYRSNYFWAKADLLRVLRKGDNPRLEFRACLKSNSMKATAYKNFLQRRSVQIKAK